MVRKLGFHPLLDSSRLRNSGRCSSNPSGLAASASSSSSSRCACAGSSAPGCPRPLLDDDDDESFRLSPGIDRDRARERAADSARRASSADTLPRVAGSSTYTPPAPSTWSAGSGATLAPLCCCCWWWWWLWWPSFLSTRASTTKWRGWSIMSSATDTGSLSARTLPSAITTFPPPLAAAAPETRLPILLSPRPRPRPRHPGGSCSIAQAAERTAEPHGQGGEGRGY
uniref:Uncharacterized protein n=1 Tax=Zea mays TaxID=4577 RepID=C0HE52_MAIZE|nr:unknown [Zea mays]